MTDLYDLHDRPSLHEPLLVIVLEGWIDAGYAAATAAQTLLQGLDTYPVATFDADSLLDHRARRPILHLVDGVNTGMSWPGIELRGATDENGRDLLLLLGSEPDHSWRAFTEAALGLAQDLGTRMVIGLGAYPATVPHTRPVTMSVTASSDDLAAASGLLRGSLDVPAGVQAAIEHRSGELDIPAMGLWAQVPHYVTGDGTFYHAAALALLERLAHTGGMVLPTGTLADDAAVTRSRIDTALAANPEHLTMLHNLETYYDEQVAQGTGTGTGGPIPTADELAAEVEQFLRDQGNA